MEIIVGSTALKYHNISRKEPKDCDIWSSVGRDTQEGEDLKVIPAQILSMVKCKDGYATPDSIYTIKCSHLGWRNPMWNKHKLDVIWLNNMGCKILPDLFKELVKYWNKELGDKSFLNMNKTKVEFFTDEVDYKYDHDYLHELVAYPNKPIYTKVLREGEDVLIDKNKFDTLTFDNKVRMFREEIAVIACERWLFNDKLKSPVSWVQAHSLSLQKTITNLTKGWATEFIVLNLQEFIKPDFTYFEHILNTIEER